MNTARQERHAGLLYALLAYTLWGLLPAVFKWMQDISVWVILVHRIIWTALFTGLLVVFSRSWPALRAMLNRKHLGWLGLSSLLIGFNWLLFVWAVDQSRIMETSLGYYITPLMNVLLGMLFLRERIQGLEWLALTLAAGGTAWLVISHGSLPWVSLSLAITFGFYGLVRKHLAVSALHGLFLETLFLLPLALLALPWVDGGSAHGFLQGNWLERQQLMLLGIITTIPLMAFAAATRRLPLATVGMVQYLAPTLSLLLAVLVYDEPFTQAHKVSFTLIWAGLAVYSFSLWQRSRSVVEMIE